MHYSLIATLGPATREPGIWASLLEAGATAFRLNTSHLSIEQLHGWLDKLEPFLTARHPVPPLVLDLQGSKWRLGQFEATELALGQQVRLVLAASSTDPNLLPVPHLDFFKAAQTYPLEIVLNDAKARLQILSSGEDWLQARVIQPGPVASNKGITLPASTYRHESLSEKDATILKATRHLGFVRYALSYLRDAQEIKHYRALVGPHVYLIAKLEREQAVAQAQAIAGLADELWLCRGDLGAELGLLKMAQAVRDFSLALPHISKPVTMAGQVLEHMTASPTPTRSEVCYLYDTLQNGYAGLVLSDETAVGRYPLESLRIAAMFRDEPVKPPNPPGESM